MNIGLLIILTPYHALQLSRLIQKGYLEHDSYGVFISSKVDLKYFHKIFSEIKIEFLDKIIDNPILLKSFIKDPIKEIPRLKEIFRDYEHIVDENLYWKGNHYTIYSGSDKSLFCQFLFSKFQKKDIKSKICLVDEGIGFYKKPKFYDFIINYFYLLFSSFIFPFRIRFVRVMGSDPRVSKIYIRNPELLSVKRKHIEYIKIPIFQTKKDGFYKTGFTQKRKTILMLTSPLSEDGRVSLKEELTYYTSIIQIIYRQNYFVCMKPHPRENDDKYDAIKKEYRKDLWFLSKAIPIEEVEYFQFDRIIHFNSSACIDIILSGFNKSNILNVFLKKRNSEMFETPKVYLHSNSLKNKIAQFLDDENAF